MTGQSIFNRLSEGVNSTTFLTGVGITGTITTAMFTGRASYKAAHMIQDRDTREHPMTKKEKVKLVWPLYVAPASVGTTTIIAIVLANREASKKIAALTVASGISERALIEYKSKVAEKIGKAKETAIRDEIAQDRVRNYPANSREIIIAGAGEVLCFDITTGRYFQSSVEKIRQAENKVNYDIIAHDYASLSSFYDEIGLPATPYSDTVGWNTSNRLTVQFSTVMSIDDRPCVAIDFEISPFVEYSRLW